MRQLAILVLAFTGLHSRSTEAQAKYTVRGVVVTPEGSKTLNAYVTALPSFRPGSAHTMGSAGTISWSKVDEHGAFLLSLLPGRYEIRAKAADDGYPDPNALLSVDGAARFPSISVEHSDLSGIEVRLGKKGGVLRGFLHDGQTKAPIAQGKVTIQDSHNAERFVELFTNSDGYFQFAIPSKPVIILASARAYSPVYFENREPLLLSNGEQREISIELHRK